MSANPAEDRGLNRKEAKRRLAGVLKSGGQIVKELRRHELPDGTVGIVAITWKPSDDWTAEEEEAAREHGRKWRAELEKEQT